MKERYFYAMIFILDNYQDRGFSDGEWQIRRIFY